MKPIACIRFQKNAPLGIIEEVLEARSVPWSYVDAWAEPMPAASSVSGLIVLGGGMNVDQVEAHPYLSEARSLVGAALDSDVPVLGICLGAQMMIRALGSAVSRGPVREIGFQRVRATEGAGADEVLGGFAPSFEVFQFHEDVCELPEECDLLFTGEDVEVQAFRVRERRAWGVQFHFEVTETEIVEWCDETPDLEETWGATKRELLDAASELLPAQQARGRDAAGRFIEAVTA